MKLVCSDVYAIDVWITVRAGNVCDSMARKAIQDICFVKSEVGVVGRGDRNEAPKQTNTASEVICKEPA